MSSDFYFRKWKKALARLEDIVNLDVQFQVHVKSLWWRKIPIAFHSELLNLILVLFFLNRLSWPPFLTWPFSKTSRKTRYRFKTRHSSRPPKPMTRNAVMQPYASPQSWGSTWRSTTRSWSACIRTCRCRRLDTLKMQWKPL